MKDVSNSTLNYTFAVQILRNQSVIDETSREILFKICK